MNTFFLNLNAWHWIGFATLLFIIEMLTGTGFLLWMGISAVFVSLLLLIISSLNIGIQLIVFSIFSVISALVWRLYLHYHPTKTDKPKLNRRAEQFIGRKFTLQSPIVNGMGQIQVDDSIWRLKCDQDLPAGTSIQICGADGIILIASTIQPIRDC